nr:tight junction protein ZO 3 [Hymenolepis microstoma]
MERGKHPVLNLRSGAIEALISNGVAPMVLMTAVSPQQIRTVMEMYQPWCSRGGSSSRDARRQLWAEISDLRVTIAHLITDSVLLSSSSDGKFDETEWIHSLVSIIGHHQRQPVGSKDTFLKVMQFYEIDGNASQPKWKISTTDRTYQ